MDAVAVNFFEICRIVSNKHEVGFNCAFIDTPIGPCLKTDPIYLLRIDESLVVRSFYRFWVEALVNLGLFALKFCLSFTRVCA